MGFTWLGNRYFTFRDRRALGYFAAIQEWLKFAAPTQSAR